MAGREGGGSTPWHGRGTVEKQDGNVWERELVKYTLKVVLYAGGIREPLQTLPL